MSRPDLLTYRFPRTQLEAFGMDARGACAITRYRERVWPKLLLWLLGLAAAVVAVLYLAR